MNKSLFIFFVTLLASAKAYAGLGSYTAAELNQIIQSNNITKIEELIRKISADDDLASFNIMTRDPEIYTDLNHPRVIGTSQTAPRSIIAFSGKKGERGYDRLQVLEFDSVRGIFVPHEFTFPGELGQSGPVTWVAEPPRCLRCHSDQKMFGEKPTYQNTQIIPIWDAYSGIAGFLGDESSQVADDSLAPRTAKIVKYLKSAERYRALKPLEIKERNSFKLSAHLEWDAGEIGEQLTIWNGKRIHYFFKAQSNYSDILPVFVAAIGESKNTEFVELANSKLKTQLTVEQLVKREEELARQNADYVKSRDARRIRAFYFPENKIDPEMRDKHLQYFGKINQAVGIMNDVPQMVRLHWLLEHMGFKNKKLSSIFEQGDMGASQRFGLMSAIRRSIEEDDSCAKALKR